MNNPTEQLWEFCANEDGHDCDEIEDFTTTKRNIKRKQKNMSLFYSYQGTDLQSPPQSGIISNNHLQRGIDSMHSPTPMSLLPNGQRLSPLNTSENEYHSGIPTPQYSNSNLELVEDYSDEAELKLTPDFIDTFSSGLIPLTRSFSNNISSQDVLIQSRSTNLGFILNL